MKKTVTYILIVSIFCNSIPLYGFSCVCCNQEIQEWLEAQAVVREKLAIAAQKLSVVKEKEAIMNQKKEEADRKELYYDKALEVLSIAVSVLAAALLTGDPVAIATARKWWLVAQAACAAALNEFHYAVEQYTKAVNEYEAAVNEYIPARDAYLEAAAYCDMLEERAQNCLEECED